MVLGVHWLGAHHTLSSTSGKQQSVGSTEKEGIHECTADQAENAGDEEEKKERHRF